MMIMQRQAGAIAFDGKHEHISIIHRDHRRRNLCVHATYVLRYLPITLSNQEIYQIY